MKDLFQASKVLLLDMASTLLFLAVYVATDNLFLAVGLGMALGLAQIGWQLFHRQSVEALQWLSLVIILASGAATFATDDPFFVMIKPTIIYVVVGVVMLKRGWMVRYIPEIARQTVPDLAITFGYVWAALMFFSAGLNIALALSLDVTTWAAVKSVWAIGSKVALFLIQYAVMKSTAIRRVRTQMAATG
ncbi:inner membrane-spanning protein YciB [Reyranella sp.]|uniref:inner membrane-spanning protein YciB n=1 Tax=Reyranella sp. TaxID=1929291 RepID=UPI0027304549|nr:septation protein IspZ [Reyranella sp.]MDP2375602.1 septation protein IspZ [Reyranella sp.]